MNIKKYKDLEQHSISFNNPVKLDLTTPKVKTSQI